MHKQLETGWPRLLFRTVSALFMCVPVVVVVPRYASRILSQQSHVMGFEFVVALTGFVCTAKVKT